MSRTRRLTAAEVELGRGVFGEAIAWARVRISVRRWGPWAVTVGSRITFPPTGAPADFAGADVAAQAWLVHELTHVWQFQNAPLRTLASWVGVLASGGYGRDLSGYRYALPLMPWEELNLEQQASAIEHAFLLRRGVRTAGMPAGAALGFYHDLPFASSAQASSSRRRRARHARARAV